MFDRRRFLRPLCLATLAVLACMTAVEPDGDPPNGDPSNDSALSLAVSPDDPHYLQGSDGHPLFLLGYGHTLDWYHPTKYEDLQIAYTDNGLSFLRIQLPWAGPDVSLVAYTHQRTGPGNALDGGLKFDLTQIDTAFLDRLEDVVSWARDNGIIVAVGLFHDWPFETHSFSVETDYNWQGSVMNPANRINTQGADLFSRHETGRPDFYDLLGLQGGCNGGWCWDVAADRLWLRDRVKEVLDAVLERLAPYGNWFAELSSRGYWQDNSKRYWANYLRGIPHTLDDGAVSPQARSDLLIANDPTSPVSTGFYSDEFPIMIRCELTSEGYPTGVNDTFVNVQNEAGADRLLYDMNVVLLGNSEGILYDLGRPGLRRASWQALVAGGHFEAFYNHNYVYGEDPQAVSFLPDLAKLMAFIRAVRSEDRTIEGRLVHMRPDNSRITSTRSATTGPFALEYKPGQTEAYLVFANGGTNPTVNVDSAGLTITRLDTVTGVEDIDPGSPTNAGNNVLTGTGNDTAWWIASAASAAGQR